MRASSGCEHGEARVAHVDELVNPAGVEEGSPTGGSLQKQVITANAGEVISTEKLRKQLQQ